MYYYRNISGVITQKITNTYGWYDGYLWGLTPKQIAEIKNREKQEWLAKIAKRRY